MKRDKDAREHIQPIVIDWNSDVGKSYKKSFAIMAHIVAYIGVFHVWRWAFDTDSDLGSSIVVMTIAGVIIVNFALYLERREKRLKKQKFQRSQEYFGTSDPHVDHEFDQIIKLPTREKDQPPKDDAGGCAVA